METDRPPGERPPALVAADPPPSRAYRAGLWLGIVAILLFLYLVRDVLPPFLIALAAATLLDPPIHGLRQRGWSRRAVTLVVFAVFLLGFAVVALVLVPAAVRQAAELAENLPAYYADMAQRMQSALTAHHTLLSHLHLPTTSSEMLARYQSQLTHLLQGLVSRLYEIIAGSASRLPWLAIIPIVTFYLLQEIEPLRARIVHLVPRRHRPRFLELSERVGAVFSGYVRGLILICAGYALVNGLILTLIFRLPYALMIALASGVLYAVPYVGPAAIIGIVGLVAAATLHPTPYILGVVVTVLVVEQLFDQLITPRVVGGLVGLHPVVSLFALTAGGQLFGLPGMILAVPVAASVQVVLLSLWPALTEPLPLDELTAPAAPASVTVKTEKTVAKRVD